MGTWPVACLENEPLARFILEKRESFLEKEGFKEKLDATISKAHRNVCEWKDPICNLRDASKVKGIGTWMLKLLKGFFPEERNANCDDSNDAGLKAKKTKGYVPQKSSAPYAVLLTLYRAMQEGHEFMKKQELIDAAEASGLSRMPIQSNKCSGPSGQFGFSTKDWYSGWSSMKTLLTKGLVVKSSCPAKYMLTEEGKITAEECLQRSGMMRDVAKPGLKEGIKKCTAMEPSASGSNCKASLSSNHSISAGNFGTAFAAEECLQRSGMAVDVAKPGLKEGMKKCMAMVPSANGSICKTTFSLNHSISAVNFRTAITVEGASHVSLRVGTFTDTQKPLHIEDIADVSSSDSEAVVGDVGRFTSTTEHVYKMQDPIACPSLIAGKRESNSSWLHLPPLRAGERFSDAYDVIIILDDREQFVHDGKGLNSRVKFADRLRAQYQIEVEIRHLPVGDTLWLARHKLTRQEYVLDFIVERKKVSDLFSSIKDTRYKQQKLRLMRCGLRKLLYVVEGDPNVMDSAESIKTACFTTEIAEGFDVQRTRDVAETLRKYGELTHAITSRCNEIGSCQRAKQNLCRTYDEFLEHCKDLEKEKVSDVFGVMLMQVKHVTENIALSILEKYPTPLSLVLAYSELEGNLLAQEQLLKGIPILNQNKDISTTVSKSIFKFICSPEAD